MPIVPSLRRRPLLNRQWYERNTWNAITDVEMVPACHSPLPVAVGIAARARSLRASMVETAAGRLVLTSSEGRFLPAHSSAVSGAALYTKGRCGGKCIFGNVPLVVVGRLEAQHHDGD
jgi:hypothetical protein